MPVALSGALAGAIVLGFGLGPRGPALQPPFANLHRGNPTGLPSYSPTQSGGGVSEGTFEHVEMTTDSPERVLDYYERAIDRSIWTVQTRGRSNIALVLLADPRVRGGVVTLQVPQGTHITLFVNDMKLPDGFPVDFPMGDRARALGPGVIANGVYHVRWDIGGNHNDAGFIERFSQALEDAGWQVLTKYSTGRLLSITCRSRTRPEVSCRVLVSVEAVREPQAQYYTSVADVWVGSGAEDAR